MSKKTDDKPNELFALHLDGQVLEPDVWKKYSRNYGGQQLYGWRPPKKVYYTLGRARAGRSHLPQQIRDKVEIVRYVPAEVIDEDYEKLAKAKKKAARAKKCAHEITEEFRWEHDDGYGTQAWITGLRCKVCGAENNWGSASGLWYLEGRIV